MERAHRFMFWGCAGAALLAASPAIYAHEKWFTNASAHPTRWQQIFSFPYNVGVSLAVLATVVLALVWRSRGRREWLPGPEDFGATPAGRARFYALAPLLLGIHVGTPLIVLGITGHLFSPNNALTGPWLYFLGVTEIGIGLSVLYGGLARFGGAALCLLWLVGAGVVGLESMLENAHYLGFGAFFALTGRGPYAIDRLLFPALEPTARLSRLAMPCLRIGTGLGLATVAFTEKLANQDLAGAFLQQYPVNFTAWLHLPMSDGIFIVCAGSMELLIGLCLIGGIFPRLIVASAWVLINMTLTVFNWVELVGHLPLYGVMAMLLVWTPDQEDQRLWIEGVCYHRAPRTGQALVEH
jgi:uncharacterized membrane protein YphA (DoxX/SURF4 family)